MDGADIYQISKNCRTSVGVIEKHYAAYNCNVIDATASNVRKDRPLTGGKLAKRRKPAGLQSQG